ncbi:MAG: hypothetical protein ACR2K5_12845, partial [Pseudolabrys sp.]
MQSVASEAATSMSFQGPSPRPARSSSDPSQGNTVFASLVDSTAATDARSTPTQDQSAPSRRSDTNNNSTAADNSRSREAAPAGQSAKTDLVNNNQGINAAPPSAAGPGATTDAPSQPRGKSAGSQADGTKSTANSSSSDASAAADPASAATAADATLITAPNAIAVVIPVHITLTAVAAPPTAAATSGPATAPLAI